MHAISIYRDNRPTKKNKQTATNPQTGPITIHTAPQLARSVMTSFVDGQLSDIISLHCMHCALTHDTMPPGSGRGTSPRITNGGNGICLEFPSLSLNI